MKQDSFDYTTVLAGNKSHVHKSLVWLAVILRHHALQPTQRCVYILLVVLLVKQFYLASTYSYVDDSHLDVGGQFSRHLASEKINRSQTCMATYQRRVGFIPLSFYPTQIRTINCLQHPETIIDTNG